MLKPLPIGIQTFRKLREKSYVYVDKTRWIYRLITEGEVYFLSRPRRFGKSLLLSTMEEIFLGNRELFRGLWIYGAEYEWESYPVVHLDMGTDQVKSAEELDVVLKGMVRKEAERYGIEVRGERYQWAFQDLIEGLGEKRKVVVLIDEYDKPLLDNLEDVEEAKRIQEVLKGFYTVLKGMDRYLRFVFLTGVTKFSKVGVFSGLNNPEDITMAKSFSGLLGVTQEELERDFAEHIQAFAAEQGVSEGELLREMRRWYDGFCFSRVCERVYNPLSVLMAFKQRQFSNYWFETGTPTFLLKLIEGGKYAIEELEALEVNELAFSSYEVERLEVVPLLFQSGYLTIKGYDGRRRLYRLGYPNLEVEDAFTSYLMGAFSGVSEVQSSAYLWQLIDALEAGELEKFFEVLQVFFADIPYDIQLKREKYYQTIFYLIFKLIGLKVGAEVRTNKGRIDAVVEVESGVYIFEFKLGGEAERALRQIRERGYAEKYLGRGKPLHLVGVQFDMEGRGVTEWQTESVEG